jgi:nucleotide-binding universal stress UspA family protein
MMKKPVNFQRILCPTDMSRESEEGLRYAVAIAHSYGAKLFVCHSDEGRQAAGALTDRIMREAIEEQVARTLTSFVDAVGTFGLDWEPVITKSGRPAEAIVREAAGRKVDLIVMSSRRRPRASSLLGSTAEAISRHAPCPVLVTHPPEVHKQAAAPLVVAPRRVLIAHDFSDDSELALRYGLSLAQEYKSEVHMLHVISDAGTGGQEISWDSPDAESPYHVAARMLHQRIPAEVHLWCQVTHTVREGRPHQEILSYAAGRDVDLICIGAHGQGFQLGTLFGSTADRVLREARCPVLVARPVNYNPDSLLAGEKGG